MAHWERSIEIDAPSARVWEVMADVARWPEWTDSIRSVSDVSPNFGPGSTAMVDAVGAPLAKYTVTQWEPGLGFVWATKVRGVSTVGSHWITPIGEGRSRATLSIDVQGLAGTIFRPFLNKTMTRNLRMESEGLKARSEQVHQPA